jgi:hypothetical protein
MLEPENTEYGCIVLFPVVPVFVISTMPFATTWDEELVKERLLPKVDPLSELRATINSRPAPEPLLKLKTTKSFVYVPILVILREFDDAPPWAT